DGSLHRALAESASARRGRPVDMRIVGWASNYKHTSSGTGIKSMRSGPGLDQTVLVLLIDMSSPTFILCSVPSWRLTLPKNLWVFGDSLGQSASSRSRYSSTFFLNSS